MIYVSPHLTLPDIGELQDRLEPMPGNPRGRPQYPLVLVDPTKALSCGIPGLDEMLAGDQDYWSKPTRGLLEDAPAPTRKGLYPGSVTFLIGRAGTGKSNSCLQFLLAADPTDPAGDAIGRCLYVNFENLFSQVLDWFPGDDAQKARLMKCQRLYRRRTQFDYAHFVHELYYLIQEHDIERVVFDGLTDLDRVDATQEFEFLLEELIVLVRKARYALRRRQKADLNRLRATGAPARDVATAARKVARPWQVTIFVSLEADPDSPDAARYEQKNSPADNVVVFRQVKINDERRKTVEVRKARRRAPDRQVRELLIRHKSPFPLRVVPGLDNYRYVTDGQPEPVRVALQLVGENPAAARANVRLTDRLDELFGYPLTAYEFTRGEIARTLRDIASGTDRIPTWDVKLFHIDEWWVRELRVTALRPPDRLLAQTRHSLLRLNAFLAADPIRGPGTAQSLDALPTDFWAVEMEKVCVPVVTTDRTPGPEDPPPFRADIIALPAYADYGLFCLNLDTAGLADRAWRTVLDAVPRVWAKTAWSGRHEWFAPPVAGGATVVNFMLAKGVKPHAWADTPADGARIGFAFDMATPATAGCTFLELCWAFGAGEDFLIRDVERNKTRKSLIAHPAVRAVSLLMFLVAEGLMPPRTTLPDTRRAVFSRHWSSSLPFVDENTSPRDTEDPPPHPAPADQATRRSGWVKRPPVRQEPDDARARRAEGLTVCPVPFFPLGAVAADVCTRVCVHDAVVRFGRLLKRTEAAVAYRADLRIGKDRVFPDDGGGKKRGPRAVGDRLRKARAKLAELFRPGPGDFAWWDAYRPWMEALPTPVNPGAGPVVRQLVETLREAGRIVRDAVLESPLFGCGRGYEHRRPHGVGLDPEYPTNPSPTDPRHWPHLPYAMFLDVRDVLEMLRWNDHRLDALDAGFTTGLGSVVLDRPPDEPDDPPGTAALSGFSCEGSWLVGADRTTRSPNLSAKFLTEMTSLESGQERAWLGAGIPARKDFYEYHGHAPVPFAPDATLTWNRLLTAVGSRSRRRSRSFCSRVRVSLVFAEIDRLVFDCLTRAEARRKDYRNATSRTQTKLVGELVGAAADAVHALFVWVREEMRAQYGVDDVAHRAAYEGRMLSRRECVTCPNRAGCAAVIGGVT